MSTLSAISGMRVVAASVISVLAAASWVVLMDGLSPKTHASILGAFAFILLLGELLFWNAIKGLNDSLLPETMGGLEFQQFAARVHRIKTLLQDRFVSMLVLKAVAGFAAAFLTTEPSATWSRVWELLGVAALTLTIPLALGNWRVWREADALRVRLLAEQKLAAERTAALDALKGSEAPAK